jgi:hypothetical protein
MCKEIFNMTLKNTFKNICKKILKTSVAIAIGVSAIGNSSSLAANVTYKFAVKNLDGSLAGQTYYGNISFDDIYLTGQGTETIRHLDNNLSFKFNFLGDDYDETNDPFERTQVTFVNGKPKSIYFRGNYDSYPSIPYTFGFHSYYTDSNYNIFPVDFYYLIDGINGSSGNGKVVFLNNGNGSTSSVPEPSAIVGMSAIAIAVAANKKAKRTL